jgi:hypothetical protein
MRMLKRVNMSMPYRRMIKIYRRASGLDQVKQNTVKETPTPFPEMKIQLELMKKTGYLSFAMLAN